MMIISPLQKGFCWIGVEFANKQIHPPSNKRLTPVTIFKYRTNFANQTCRIFNELEAGVPVSILTMYEELLTGHFDAISILTLKMFTCNNHSGMT